MTWLLQCPSVASQIRSLPIWTTRRKRMRMVLLPMCRLPFCLRQDRFRSCRWMAILTRICCLRHWTLRRENARRFTKFKKMRSRKNTYRLVMAMIMNEQQRKHLIQALTQNYRFDGRTLDQYRDVVIERGVSETAEGSARVRIGKTDIFAGVKLSIG